MKIRRLGAVNAKVAARNARGKGEAITRMKKRLVWYDDENRIMPRAFKTDDEAGFVISAPPQE